MFNSWYKGTHSELIMQIYGVKNLRLTVSTELTVTDNIGALFFGNELIDQEFKDVYTGLYSCKERYVDIVTAL